MRCDYEAGAEIHKRIDARLLIGVIGYDACLGICILKHLYLLIEDVLERLVAHYRSNTAGGGVFHPAGFTFSARHHGYCYGGACYCCN